MKTKPKIIVVLGPTASGKSDLAVSLARKWGGEVISADSRQVYKGLDIGSGKITKKEMKRVPHHLLDVVSPSKVFSVSDYKKLADKEINKIIERGKLPIICGGTGFYIDAVVKNIILPEVPPNRILRKKLEAKSASELFAMLKKLDKVRAKNIDSENKVRLIRAIEISEALGKVPKTKEKPLYDAVLFALEWDKDELRERINLRLKKRIKQGMIKEVQDLRKSGVSWKRLLDLGLEYRYVALYLQKKMTKEEMTEELQNKIWQYAKRQMTWFKRDKNIVWIKGGEENLLEKIAIKNTLHNS